MYALNEYLEVLLEVWGKWSRDDKGKYVSNIEMIQKAGGVSNKTYGSRPIFENEQAEEVDSWVGLLIKHHPVEGKTLCEYYTTGASKEQLAERSGLSRRTIDERLRIARTWLEGILSLKLAA
jgi:uncharacterized protein YidB (DUF937 family)